MKRSKLVLDVAALVTYAVAAAPFLTGVSAHEFVGVGAFLVMAAHLVAGCDGLAGRHNGVRAVVNAVLLVSLCACVVSGVMVSGMLLPLLGIYATGYFFWNPLHAVSAKVLLAAILVHCVIHAPAVFSRLRRRGAEKFDARGRAVDAAEVRVRGASQDEVRARGVDVDNPSGKEVSV
ncbi:MAG: DUF4405 domain-containing protein [Eggerthellaceae bacterium]|nr:DUF4405 domain-containing protein [Eggerthellaceae bacterium]